MKRRRGITNDESRYHEAVSQVTQNTKQLLTTLSRIHGTKGMRILMKLAHQTLVLKNKRRFIQEDEVSESREISMKSLPARLLL